MPGVPVQSADLHGSNAVASLKRVDRVDLMSPLRDLHGSNAVASLKHVVYKRLRKAFRDLHGSNAVASLKLRFSFVKLSA